MALDPDSVAAIGEFLQSRTADHAALVELRRMLPGVSVNRCDQSDVADETPFKSFERCDLYLLDGRDHCWKLTTQLDAATGLVLAAKGA
ncbi:hypothetical protein [Methylocella sp.]|uniref:hypothetical protein n=1 Tax=Methylocella sp. TaxID=1978226 RepID=UPI00378302C8